MIFLINAVLFGRLKWKVILMKRFLCVLLSVLFFTGCFAACTNPTDNETSVADDDVTTEAADDYLEPTEEELEKLVWMTYGTAGVFDCEAEDAVERAYAIALRYDGLYQQYTDGKAFAKSEFIDSDEADPRDLFFDGKENPAYAYLKTPADSVDRFMREIMNVEPDHEIELNLDWDFPVIYYDNGYYYTRFDIYGHGFELDVYKHSVDADGWDEVVGGVFNFATDENGEYLHDENGKAVLLEEPDYTWPILAKIVLIDGERYWSFKHIG